MLKRQHRNIFVVLFTLLLHLKTFAQQGVDSILFENFDTLKYDKVIAFNYNYDSTLNKKTWHDRSITQDKMPYKAIKKSYIKTLDKKGIQKLISTITDSSTYGLQYADCFEPRLGIAFIKGKTPVFIIEICFDCGYLETTIPLKAARHKYYDNETTDENKNPVFYRRYLKGFTKAGGQKLIDFCKDLNMGYCYTDKEYHVLGE